MCWVQPRWILWYLHAMETSLSLFSACFPLQILKFLRTYTKDFLMLSETRHVWGTSGISIVVFFPRPSRQLSLKSPLLWWSHLQLTYGQSPVASCPSPIVSTIVYPIVLTSAFCVLIFRLPSTTPYAKGGYDNKHVAKSECQNQDGLWRKWLRATFLPLFYWIQKVYGGKRVIHMQA